MSANITAVRPLALALAIVLMSACGLAPTCIAQTAASNSAAALAMRDNEIRLINKILSGFSEVMDPRERAILQDIDIRVPMDYNMTRVVAYRDDRRVIEVSFGFLGVLLEACDNWILAEYYSAQDPGIYGKYEAYLAYLNQVIDRNERALGQEPTAPQPFAARAGIPAEVAAAIMERSDARDYNGRLRVAAIAFVLGHELGHHMLGHADTPQPSSPAASRAREAEADRYAAALTMRAGIPAFGALPALVFFAAAEGTAPDPDATHPLAACRILGAMMYTVDRLAADRRYVSLFEKAPDMLPGRAQYNTLMTQMDQNCR
jgi:hypothetical protein